MKAFPYHVLGIVLLMCLASAGVASAQHEPAKPKDAEKQAERAGVEWLRLLDNNDMDAVWDRTSPQLRQAVSREQFKEQMQRMREGLGPIITRRLDNATYRTRVAGGEDGQFVVLVFNSRFTDQGRAREMLTMHYNDGDWSVAGYFVR